MDADANNLAYLAGLIDGEGCIGIRRKTDKKGYLRFDIRVLICNNDLDVLEWVKSQFGGYMRTAQNRNPNWRPVSSLEFRGLDAAKLLERVIPFMRIRAAQAELAIVARSFQWMPLQKGERSRKKGRRPTEEMALNLAFCRMKKLNHRGVQVAC